MEKKKSITLVLIVLLGLLVISFGVSFAYFVSRINQEGTGSEVDSSTATAEDTVVTTNGSIGFGDTNIYPGHKNISKIVVTATGDSHVIYNLVWNGTNNLNTTLNYKVYKTTTEETPSITCTKKEKGLLRKEIYEECEENLATLGEVIKTGKIKAREVGRKVKLVKNEEIDATNTGAKVYYYIVLEYPNLDEAQNIDMNGSFTGNINVEILDKKDLSVSETLLAKNEMAHETFTSDSGETVDAGYRFQGANPKNYVRFNNELWRIIGVFDVETEVGTTESLVKLMRSDSIANMAWDTNASNDWSVSDIKTILNGQYYNGEDINYTYRNPDNSIISSNPTVSITGVSINDTARDMIESVKWNIGGTSSPSRTVSEMFTDERGPVGGAANPSISTWTGSVGLMYPSDFGYAVDSTTCSRTTMLDSYNNPDSCKTSNWLSNNINLWTMTTNSTHSTSILGVNSEGYVYNVGRVAEGLDVRPSIYLKSDVSIVDNGNDGSVDHPYELIFS